MTFPICGSYWRLYNVCLWFTLQRQIYQSPDVIRKHVYFQGTPTNVSVSHWVRPVNKISTISFLLDMDQVMQLVDPAKQFAKDSIRLVKRCTKPDRKGKKFIFLIWIHKSKSLS